MYNITTYNITKIGTEAMSLKVGWRYIQADTNRKKTYPVGPLHANNKGVDQLDISASLCTH